MFDATFPKLAHTTEEFAEIYKEREAILKELEEFRKLNPNAVAHELSDPEVGDFMEFLHTGYELGLEDKVHAMTHNINPHTAEMFSKFVKVLSSNPEFFNIAKHGV